MPTNLATAHSPSSPKENLRLRLRSSALHLGTVFMLFLLTCVQSAYAAVQVTGFMTDSKHVDLSMNAALYPAACDLYYGVATTSLGAGLGAGVGLYEGEYPDFSNYILSGGMSACWENFDNTNLDILASTDGTYFYIFDRYEWDGVRHRNDVWLGDYYVALNRQGGIWTISQPHDYYGRISNTTNGILDLRSGTSTSASILKSLPEDWILYVASTTDSVGQHITADGYIWYKVIDPTDNVTGWVTGEMSSSTIFTLPYEPLQQAAYIASSTAEIATSSRPNVILDVIDHYYNDTSSAYSLYSSDDGSNNISDLKNESFEKKVIWGIAALETGPFDFNNEVVSFDYGHGIMQLTFNAWTHEPSDPHATWDNRGVGSRIEIIPCAAINTDDYVNCYTNAGTGDSSGLKYYKPYGGNSNNPTYKQYNNSEQSIYANIKDGLRVLQDKYSGINITTSTTVNGTTYSANEREIIQVTERYNGACGYVDNVADKLDDIGTYFPTATTSDISTLIQKMHTAGDEMICAQLHSPADISIHDNKARIVGVNQGKGENDYEMAVYDRDEKFAKIFFPNEEDYTYKVIGTGRGVYGLDLTLKKGDQYTVFTARDIPVGSGEIHTYEVNKVMLEKGEKGVDIRIDYNGDGVIDKTLKAGLKLNASEFKNAEPMSPNPTESVVPEIVDEAPVMPEPGPETEIETEVITDPMPIDESLGTTTRTLLAD